MVMSGRVHLCEDNLEDGASCSFPTIPVPSVFKSSIFKVFMQSHQRCEKKAQHLYLIHTYLAVPKMKDRQIWKRAEKHLHPYFHFQVLCGGKGRISVLIYRREMKAEKLDDWELEMWDEEFCCDLSQSSGVGSNVKRALVGAGARALFYPTLLYNVVRNKIQPEFNWWDRVDEFILLGAVPFAADVPRLKKLGVGGVVTLNESYETLVPPLLYHAHRIDNLVIPTRDYLFAPSLNDTRRAVDFIHSNASLGRTTYVHCKAGRGRSTTIVLCYLVEHKQMTPDAAYNYVKCIRPRVVLASAQWQAVQDYYMQKVKKTSSGCINSRVSQPSFLPYKQYDAPFDDEPVDMVTESDLDGYESCSSSCDSQIMVQ